MANSTPSGPSISSSGKAPRAINAIDIFAQEQAEEISIAMAERRKVENMTPKESNLRYHREIKVDMFNQLTEEERADYTTRADTQNAKKRDGADATHIKEYAFIKLDSPPETNVFQFQESSQYLG